MDNVYTIEAIHDAQPLSGVADCDGRPYFYQRLFDEALDDWSDQYLLRAIDRETVEKALKRKDIFLRWRAAFDANQTAIDTHPALPSDRAQYDLLSKAINDKIAQPDTSPIKRIGHFEVSSPDGELGKVTWIVSPP